MIKKERNMILFQMLILYWALLLLLLSKSTAATSSSSSLASSPSSCEAVDNNNDDGGGLSWEQIEAKVDQTVAGVTREVVQTKIFNHIYISNNQISELGWKIKNATSHRI